MNRAAGTLLILALGLGLGGCGSGIGDGKWRTVLFEDFDVSDGAFNSTTFPDWVTSVNDPILATFSIVTGRLSMTGGDDNKPVVFYNKLFESSVRVTVAAHRPTASGTPFFGVGARFDEMVHNVGNGVTCQENNEKFILVEIGSDNVTILGQREEISWPLSGDRTFVLTVDQGEARCEVLETGDVLFGPYTKRTKGFVAVSSNSETGPNPDFDAIHVDWIRIETR